MDRYAVAVGGITSLCLGFLQPTTAVQIPKEGLSLSNSWLAFSPDPQRDLRVHFRVHPVNSKTGVQILELAYIICTQDFSTFATVVRPPSIAHLRKWFWIQYHINGGSRANFREKQHWLDQPCVFPCNQTFRRLRIESAAGQKLSTSRWKGYGSHITDSSSMWDKTETNSWRHEHQDTKEEARLSACRKWFDLLR